MKRMTIDEFAAILREARGSTVIVDREAIKICRAIESAAYERAAKVCDVERDEWGSGHDATVALRNASDAIRAMAKGE